MNKLAGITIAKNTTKYDYCIKECILSMLPVCDAVFVAYVESEDDTLDVLLSIDSDKVKIIHLSNDEWDLHNSKERLSYITNIAISEAELLGYKYVLYAQADECLHEMSYPSIKLAIESNHESFLINRINLWKDCNHELNVPQDRKPCSTEIIRLAKSKYRAYDDAESILAPALHIIDNAYIVHYGFVRKKEVMKDKIINMQQGVFAMADYDSKLDLCDVFNPDLWFDTNKDLIPLRISTPKVMEDWVKSRP